MFPPPAHADARAVVDIYSGQVALIYERLEGLVAARGNPLRGE